MSSINSMPYASNKLTVSLMSVGLVITIIFFLNRVYAKTHIAKKVTCDDGKRISVEFSDNPKLIGSVVTCVFAVVSLECSLLWAFILIFN